ncbi:MAG: protein kinase [Muribaculaceae bacterium]|nr:protein kinase [Muribaculaceae bacterium]
MMDTSAFTGSRQEAFPDAELLPLGGSTCQCYRVKLYGKLHFLKRLKPELQSNPRHVAALNKEFETGYRLEHPHLVRYISKSDDGILMDYVDGETLSEFSASNHDYFKNRKNADCFVRQLVDVVGYLHSHQVIHLDLKPDNILVTRIGHDIKLIDLGYCYTDTYTDTMGRTDSFAAPEQLDGTNDVDARTDIYAIGRILQTLPCAPFYNDIIDRCTHSDKDKRYHSTSDIIYQLDHHHVSRRWLWLLLLIPLVVGIAIYLYQRPVPFNSEDNESVATIEQSTDTGAVLPESAPQVIHEQQPMIERLPEALQQPEAHYQPSAPAVSEQSEGQHPSVKQASKQPNQTEVRPDLVSVPQSKPNEVPAPTPSKTEVRIPSMTSKPAVAEKPKPTPTKTTTTPSIPSSIGKSANKDILALRNELQSIAQPIYNRMLAAYRDSSYNEINRSRFNMVQTDFRDAIMQRYYPLWDKYRKAGKVSERDFYVECSETWLYYCNNLYYQMQRNAGNSAYRNKHYHYYDKD